MPVNWTAENDRKLLLNLITNLSTKDVDAEGLATLFPGATPKAIIEHVHKLRRELKASQKTTAPTTTTTTTTTESSSTNTNISKPNPKARAKPNPNTNSPALPRSRPKKSTTVTDRGVGIGGGDSFDRSGIVGDGGSGIQASNASKKRKFEEAGNGEGGGKKGKKAGGEGVGIKIEEGVESEGSVQGEDLGEGGEMEEGEVVVDEEVY